MIAEKVAIRYYTEVTNASLLKSMQIAGITRLQGVFIRFGVSNYREGCIWSDRLVESPHFSG